MSFFRLKCLATLFIIFNLSLSHGTELTFDKNSILEHIHSNSSKNKIDEYIYITGNPFVQTGNRSNGRISDVKEKFELAALYAYKFKNPKDRATFLFFKKLEDESYIQKMEDYAKLAGLKNHKFIWFSQKQELFEYITSKKEPGSIKGLFFFTHSFPNGINIGIKNAWGDLDQILTPADKKRLIINDPQTIRAENFNIYMERDKYKQMKSNFASDINILFAGCKPSVEKYIFRKAFYQDFDGKPFIPKYPENYIKWIKIYSLANRIASALEIPLISTQSSTHFETIDENSKKFRWISENESIKPGSPLIMFPDKGLYEYIYPDKRYNYGLEKVVSLKFIPIKPFTPQEKYENFYKRIKNKNKEIILKAYKNRMDFYTSYMKKYNEDYKNLPPNIKDKYEKELEIRTKHLKELLDKERKYRLNQSITQKAIYWYRRHYGKKISREREKLGLPPTKIWFGRKLTKNPAYFLENLYYYEWEKYTDFTDIRQWD